MMTDRLRTHLTPDERALDVIHTIDPGFVHHRLIQTIIGDRGMELLDEQIRKLPSLPDWQRKLRIDHLYMRTLLIVCEVLDVPSLSELAARTHLRAELLVCSTDKFKGTETVYTAERVTVEWLPCGDFDYSACLELSTKHIASDTLRMELSKTSTLSCVAQIREVQEQKMILAPLLIGGPWLLGGTEEELGKLAWFRYEFYEHYVEDIDEFEKVSGVSNDVDWSPMGKISEAAFKQCLVEDILGDPISKDWGGETSDHFSSHIHIRGRRVTAAFLLKGPARFRPMRIVDLGKNGDQVRRLATEPANLLVVQHCHEISPDVRDMIRAFAVQPHNPRRYCLIDGRDSFRLLLAYNLVEKALELSNGKT